MRVKTVRLSVCQFVKFGRTFGRQILLYLRTEGWKGASNLAIQCQSSDIDFAEAFFLRGADCMSDHTQKRQKLETMSAATKMAAIFDSIKHTRVFSGPINENSKYLLGTHDGSFHCDEAMALSFLKILPQYRDSEILRTRNPDLLSKCHMVVDVGAVFDAEKLRFDHHQREFNGVLDSYKTKLSSAGLVYQHFGRQVLKEVLTTEEPPTDEFVEICFHKLYKGFVEHIDAIDNGISVSDETPRYLELHYLKRPQE